jgi:protein-L-isoaspartate(D-aspartate) O-methyltransferase
MNADRDEREAFAAFLLRIRARGIDDRALIGAIESVPRRNFVAARWHEALWSRGVLPIDCGQSIEPIDLQALMLHALGLTSSHRVLEIGTGSGFTAAVMGRLAGKIISLERFRRLTEQAKQQLEALGFAHVIVRQAEGSGGLPAEGPFDRIIAWAAFDSVPRHFVDQLSTNGIMVAPLGPGDGVQSVTRLTKVGSRFEREDIAEARFQPLLPGIAAVI